MSHSLPNGKIIHIFGPGSLIPLDKHQAVGELLEELVSGERDLTPEQLLDVARPVDSIIHPYFEWDDAAAAHAARLQTARTIINHWRYVVIEEKTQEQSTIRAAMSVIMTDEGGQPRRTYTNSIRTFSDKELRAQTLGDAKRKLKYWRETYKMYREFDPVFVVIDQLE